MKHGILQGCWVCGTQFSTEPVDAIHQHVDDCQRNRCSFNSIRVKCLDKNDNEITHEVELTSSFQSLMDILSVELQVFEKDIEVSYIDEDNDNVKITCDAELVEAVRGAYFSSQALELHVNGNFDAVVQCPLCRKKVSQLNFESHFQLHLDLGSGDSDLSQSIMADLQGFLDADVIEDSEDGSVNIGIDDNDIEFPSLPTEPEKPVEEPKVEPKPQPEPEQSEPEQPEPEQSEPEQPDAQEPEPEPIAEDTEDEIPSHFVDFEIIRVNWLYARQERVLRFRESTVERLDMARDGEAQIRYTFKYEDVTDVYVRQDRQVIDIYTGEQRQWIESEEHIMAMINLLVEKNTTFNIWENGVKMMCVEGELQEIKE